MARREEPKGMTSRRGRRSFLWLLSLVALATGCASSVEIPPQAVGQLLELRNGLIDGRAQIQKTTGAAKDLVERPRVDVQPQVNAFRAQMSQLSKDALQAREVATSAQTKADDFFANWDKQLQTMSAGMAEAGQQRRVESMQSFQTLRERFTAVRTEFGPFMTNLQEADKYLSSDSTTAGVKVAAPTIRKALDRESDVLRSIDDLIKQIDVVRGGK
jgi:hypothetical protein